MSNEWKLQFERLFNHKNIIVINNGIDNEDYEAGKCIVEEVRNNFLFLGRLGKRKGAYDIIYAVEKLIEKYPDIMIYMAGDGEINQIKNLIDEKKLNSNIIIMGWIDFNTKIELLQKVCTVLLPSYNEGLPMTILEGMAAGKMIISTNVGGIPELVENEINGIIINPGDVDMLSKAMVRVLEEKEFIKMCCDNNLKKIEKKFSRKKMHEKISACYERLV